MSTDAYNCFDYSVKDIGDFITQLKQQKGISSYKLSLDSTISKSVLRRIELSEREPRLSTLLKIIDGLGLTPAMFFSELEAQINRANR